MSKPIPSSAPAPVSSEPYIPASTRLVEINPTMLALSIVLAAVLAAANTYLGLFAGMTVSAAIPASVISMALLRPLGGNILQNNGVQTAASAGESVAAGVIFTMPAMLILHAWTKFDYLQVTLIASLGGLLGVLFTVPLRRALIIEQPLMFPEGVATAEVLKVGDRGGAGAKFIAIAGVIGAIFKIGTTGFKVLTDKASFGFSAGSAPFAIGTNLSPALVGVGYIVGLNVSVVIVLGGAVNWLVAIPLYGIIHGTGPGDAEAIAGGIWGAQTRYLGVGAMLVGGMSALIRLRKPLLKGIRSGMEAYKKVRGGNGGEVLRTERDMPLNVIAILGLLAAVPILFLFQHFTGSWGISAGMTLFVMVAGFLFSAVAAYMAGLVGSSNNPISGVTIATVLTASLTLLALGIHKEAGPVAAILIGGVVACAAAIGGDNMQDLKAGHLLGGTPYKLQIMQVLGAVVGALVMAPVLNLLNTSYGIGTGLPAPQASLMASVAHGVFEGGLPWGIIAIGAGIALGVIIIDIILEKQGSSFRMPVMAFAVGIYLPFELSVPIFLGGLLAWAMTRYFAAHRVDAAGREERERNGLLFSAGLITGESLMGILLAIPVAVAGDANVLRLVHTESKWLELPGLALLALVGYGLYRASTRAVTAK
jgi:putative OPT family oligopeptide transporter